MPEARNAQNELPEAYSGQVLGHKPEMLKVSLLRPMLGRFSALGGYMLKMDLLTPIPARFWAIGQKC